MIWRAVLGLQVATFLALGAIFMARGNIRLGSAQLLLAAVHWIIYSGGL